MSRPRKSGRTDGEKQTALASPAAELLERRIYTVRGQRVILDADLAEVYGVETGALNRAVKRNADRFPGDFVFLLTRQDVARLKCQIGISSSQHGGRRKPTLAFTEHGAVMAANVLNSTRAAKMSVFVVRAFVKLRQELGQNRQFAAKLAELEKKLSERLDLHEQAILHLLRQMQDLLHPPAGPAPEQKQIGFHVREQRAPYRARVKQPGVAA
jgi:phage regulator Rha-like protein